MLKAMRLGTLSVTLAMASASTLVVAAQQSEGDNTKQTTAPPAPIPAPILSAKKVFISYAGNAGVTDDIWPDHYSGGPNRAYDQFYAAMKSWGRYELVSTPADADLILELQFSDRLSVYVSRGSGGSSAAPRFTLVIKDLKTHVVLWAFFRDLQTSQTRSLTHDQSFDYALGSLVNDMATLSGAPPIIDVDAIKKKKPDPYANWQPER